MTTVRKVMKFPDQRPRSGHEMAFLPAALEIVETPPSPVGRAISATIIAAFCLALIWASFGTVDMVATAPGKIVPSGRSKTVQPFEAGVVRAIHVRDGAVVKAGDVMVELDPTISAADVEHARSDLAGAELDVARLRAALAHPADSIAYSTPPAGAGEGLIEAQRRLLAAQTAEHKARIAEISGQLDQKTAERDTITAMIAKIEATIPPLQERVNVRRYLYDRQVGTKLTYLSEFQDLVGQQHELLVQQSRRREADAAIGVLTETRTKAEAEYRRILFDELTKAEQKAAGLTQDVIKAERKATLQILTTPIDGIVQQLAVHTIGGVVTPAQPLAVVVPRDGELEIEAMVSNRDIGFVFTGQDAEIKVDTFNFTRYGLLHGRVQSVSRDAVARDKHEEPSRAAPTGAHSTTSKPNGQELVYLARVVLDRAQMEIEGRTVQLLSGMAVTVEIKTGSRRIISYLLSPLVRYRQEILRER
jgi:membrane fusion protein, hemolysin D